MAANNLEEILLTGVKFYASKSKAEALALATQANNPEPGSICFVSDNTGNYIILDGKIFGDGTTGSGGGSGGGAVVLALSNIPVIERDGQVIKTLQDYFDADGTLITKSFKVTATKTNLNDEPYEADVVVINNEGIFIEGNRVLTEQDLQTIAERIDIEGSVSELINQAEQNAKDYADSLITSLYKVKGSVSSYSNLPNNADIGDVYNVVQASGTIGTDSYVPPGTNYVWTGSSWDPLGGTVDLSLYKTAANTTAEIESKISAAINTLDSSLSSRIDANYNSISSLATSINQVSNRVTNNTTNIQNNTTNITNIATQLTWQ